MGFMFGGAPNGRISACMSSFRVTVNAKPFFTLMCNAERCRVAVVMGCGVLSSDGSARSNPPSSLSMILDGVADPVNPDPLRIRTIVEKLLPSNIQCQVPANFSTLLEASELA